MIRVVSSALSVGAEGAVFIKKMKEASAIANASLDRKLNPYG